MEAEKVKAALVVAGAMTAMSDDDNDDDDDDGYGDSDGGGCSSLFQSTAHVDWVMGDAAYDRHHRNQERV